VGLEFNGTHQLPIYADDVDLLGGNLDTVKENIRILTDASKHVDLEVNAENIKYMSIL
jgi:hypothetical protein